MSDETPPYQSAASNSGLETDPEARLWGMLAHFAGLIGFIIPFGNLLGPLIVWQVKKDQMPFVDDQGKESLNFQITISIAAVVCIVLMLVLIGLVLLPLLGLVALVLMVIAGIKANGGERYRYPFVLRLIQ